MKIDNYPTNQYNNSKLQKPSFKSIHRVFIHEDFYNYIKHFGKKNQKEFEEAAVQPILNAINPKLYPAETSCPAKLHHIFDNHKQEIKNWFNFMDRDFYKDVNKTIKYVEPYILTGPDVAREEEILKSIEKKESLSLRVPARECYRQREEENGLPLKMTLVIHGDDEKYHLCTYSSNGGIAIPLYWDKSKPSFIEKLNNQVQNKSASKVETNISKVDSSEKKDVSTATKLNIVSDGNEVKPAKRKGFWSTIKQLFGQAK